MNEGNEFKKLIIKEYIFLDDKPIIIKNISNSNEEFISYATIKIGQILSYLIKIQIRANNKR